MEYDMVIRNAGIAFLNGFESCLQKKPFRHLHMKLHLDHYNNFTLLLLKLSKNLMEWLYADKDLFIATLPAKGSLFWFCRTDSEHVHQGYGALVLGFSSQFSFTNYIYEEDEVVRTVLRRTVTLIIFRIPLTRSKREIQTKQLLQEYEDYLSSGEFKLYFKDTFRDTFKTVQESAPGSTATLGLSATAGSLGHATAGFAFTLAVDVAITIRALTKARRLRKAGEITDREFKKTVRRKVRQTSCQLVAGSTGSVIGQMVIPVPIVGAMVGGFLGSLIGTGLSKSMDKIEEVRELKCKPEKGFTRRGSKVKKLKILGKQERHLLN